jgi:hypothetical protein
MSLEENEQDEPKDLMPRVIYDAIYCPRGDMENRIKSLPPRTRGIASWICSAAEPRAMPSPPTRPG